MNKKKHGGARENAGRKKIEDIAEKRVNYLIKIKPLFKDYYLQNKGLAREILEEYAQKKLNAAAESEKN